MSTYTYVPQYTVAWRWPLFVTIAMVLIGFIPVFGLVNLLLMFPVGFFLGLNFFTHKEKMSRVYFGFLLLGISIVTPIILLGATAFIH